MDYVSQHPQVHHPLETPYAFVAVDEPQPSYQSSTIHLSCKPLHFGCSEPATHSTPWMDGW